MRVVSNIQKRISNSKFYKSVLLIAGGTALAQLSNALLSPIITRLYTPDEYGILTTFMALMGILSVVGSLKYELAIPIAEDDFKALSIITLSILVLTTISFSIFVTLFFWGDVILGLIGGDSITRYWIWLPVGVFFTGLYAIFMQYAFRTKNYKTISRTKINQSLFQNITKIGLGATNFGASGLLIGTIIGQSAGIGSLTMPFFRNLKSLKRSVTRDQIWMCAKRYSDFPKYSAPSQFLNIAGVQLPVLLLTLIYGSQVVGYFGLANSIVNIPMTLIGRSVSDVFYSEAATIGKKNPTKLKQLSDNLLKRLFILGLVPLIILLAFGPLLFSFVYGNTWHQAGVYARILAFLVFFRLIFTPISNLFSIFEKQKVAFLLDLFRVIGVILVFGISKLLGLNEYVAVSLYVLVMSVIYLLTYLSAQNILKNEILK